MMNIEIDWNECNPPYAAYHGINFLQWSPDGKLLAYVEGIEDDSDPLCNILCIRVGDVVNRIYYNRHRIFTAMCWHPTGEYLTITDVDGMIMHISPEGEIIQRIALPGFSVASQITWMKWHPDGEHLLSGGFDGAFRIMDKSFNFLHQEQLVTGQYPGLTHAIIGVDVHPSGREFAISHTQGEVLIYDFSTLQVLRRFDGHHPTYFSANYSPSGAYFLLIGGGGSQGSFIRADDGALIAHLPAEVSENLRAWAWHPNRDYVALATHTSTTYVFEAGTGICATQLTNPGYTHAIAWHSDGPIAFGVGERSPENKSFVDVRFVNLSLF